MNKYKKVPTKPDFPLMQESIISLWKERNIKKRVLKLNHDSGKLFSFYEGPPTANGNPHAGHVLTRSLKDVYTRFAGMNGYYVPRKGGWDTHGLPVEISVEKSLGISGKQDIERFGVSKFVEECKKNVWLCIDRWKEFSEKVGYSLDLDDDCYIPYTNDYIESIWWSISELDKKGVLYKGHKILPSCPSCQTALSSHEVVQGYKDRKDLTATVKCYCKELDAFFVAWTTTPWTLPSNVALCVNPKLEYSFVLYKGATYVLATSRLSDCIKGEFSVEKVVTGKDLVGYTYEPLYDYSSLFFGKKGYRIVADEYVTDSDGTGIVHIAPAYGEDDYRVGVKFELPFLQMVDQSGHFTEQCEEYKGKYIFDNDVSVNETIVIDLSTKGKLFARKYHTHNYPHCWRCGTPLIYYARDGWFVKTTAYKEELIRCNNEVNWFPDSYKTGRMGNFLQNNIDWCLTRNRFWGTPLPVWTCSCGFHKTVGSIQELIELTGCDPDIELHKPYIDEPTMDCPHCGKIMTREKDVIDVWYDSGAMPFAQFHYPFENKEEFERRYPADFIFEGYDQTRGWFYTLEAINVALFGRAPMKNCLANGMICDSNGFKMSKSKGNYEDPMIYIRKYGGDVVRFMFYSNGQPYNDVIFSENLLVETQRKFNDVLYNSYAFFMLYAGINNYDGCFDDIKNYNLTLMDRYILSKLNKLVKNVAEYVTQYKATEASRELIEFCDTLSNWYIRRCRKRFYYLNTDDNFAAFATLHTVLKTLAKVCAPFIPFLSEEIYLNVEYNLKNESPDSVHLCMYPICDESLIDLDLEKKMEDTSRFCELGRAAREKAGIKIKVPLSKMYINNESHNAETLDEGFLKIISEELNIEEVSDCADIERFLSFSIKPNLPKLGPKYGKILGTIRNYLENCDAKEIRNCVKSGGTWTISLNGTAVNLSAEDLLISSKEQEGYQSVMFDTYSVILDCLLTQELINKGYVREFISKLQKARKDNGLEITDHIFVAIDGDLDVVDTLIRSKDYIEGELLADNFTIGSGVKEWYSLIWEIDEIKSLTISFCKVKRGS